MADTYRVMTVCTGNICRSPMAEVVLRDRLEAAGLGDAVEVDSTGISDEERGNPIDRRARQVLAAHGYPVPQRRARQATAADVRSADLVLAMTSHHARSLRAMVRGDADAAAKVVMYRSFDPEAVHQAAGTAESALDLADPWYGDLVDFEDCLTQIEAAADAVVTHVAAALAARP